MVAIGMGLAWFGYGLASWGVFLTKGYNITLSQWLNPLTPYRGPWPPPANIPPGQVWPGAGGKSATVTAAGGRGQNQPPTVV